jgi:SAM-dependent methyltransferase
MNIAPEKLFGMAATFANVERRIANGDGMWNAQHAEHYFVAGASATAEIKKSLAASGRKSDSIRRVLDYACGYGRVLRWLKAEFPQAKLLGLDADKKAAAGAASVVGVETRHLDVSLSAPLGELFDLIWIGSLFTHLPEAEVSRILAYISYHLTKGGMVVFTTHGQFVYQRLHSKTRLYNLSADSAVGIVQRYDETGYGYADYPGRKCYGISIARPSTVVRLLESCDLSLRYFRAQGWDAHQDVYGCSKLA